MDVDGLGYKHLEQMVDKGIIKDHADLYSLKKDDLMKMERMGDKLAENLLNAIDKSRTPGLTNLIFALGIRNVGYHLAGVLAKHFGSIEAIRAASVEELAAVPSMTRKAAEQLKGSL